MSPEPENKQPKKEDQGKSQKNEQQNLLEGNWSYQSGIFGTQEWKVRVQAEAARKFLEHLGG